jgi:hypothetical protein
VIRPRVAAILVLVAIASGITAFFAFRRAGDVLGDLPEELRDRGTVARVGGGELAAITADGTRIVPLEELDHLARALSGHDPEAVPDAMRADGVSAILVSSEPGGVDAPDATILERLRAFGRLSPLRAVHLAPAGALYEVEPTASLPTAEREALARVARAIVGGERPPPNEAFPPSLREMRSVEIMVLLRENGSPRLWRSARGSSIARSLVTAAVVARERWIERERAMGGPLDVALPNLDVEVSLLLEDGTLGARDRAFVERVFTSAHGVAYERRSSWRYLLPQSTREAGRGSAVRAYEHLFAQNGLPPETLESPSCRLYRLVVEPLSTSPSAATRRRSVDPLPSLLGAGSPSTGE